MSENQSSRVGQTAKLNVNGDMWVEVRVTEQDKHFGRIILTIEPIAGTGKLRVNEDSLKNFAWPKEQT